MHDWFAWHPVRTQEGRIAWLSKVKREWSWEVNPWADGSGYSGYDGGWIYHEKV